MTPNKNLCPPEVVDSFRRYIDDGVPPGDFLRACLENDLRETFGRADWHNTDALPHIVAWLYNEAPSHCWGSPDAVDAWLLFKRRQRELAEAPDEVQAAIEDGRCDGTPEGVQDFIYRNLK